jgi:hypothetical protein
VFSVRYELGFYIPGDGILHSHRRQNLKSYINRIWIVYRFIEHLQIGTRSDYCPIVNSEIVQFTTAHRKHSVCCLYKSLPSDRSQQCLILLCLRSYCYTVLPLPFANYNLVFEAAVQ